MIFLKDVHVYLHRIGRSGRWGRKGSALNFVTKFDYHLLKQIEEYYNTQINELSHTLMKYDKMTNILFVK